MFVHVTIITVLCILFKAKKINTFSRHCFFRNDAGVQLFILCLNTFAYKIDVSE